MQNADSISMIVYAVSLVVHSSTNASKQERDRIQSGVNNIKPQSEYPSIRTLPPKDKHHEMYNALWFKPYCGVHEPLYDF